MSMSMFKYCDHIIIATEEGANVYDPAREIGDRIVHSAETVKDAMAWIEELHEDYSEEQSRPECRGEEPGAYDEYEHEDRLERERDRFMNLGDD